MSLTAFMRFGIRGDERRKLVTTIRQAVGLRASA
jgi:hypothetical protein